MVELQKSPLLGSVISKHMTCDRYADCPISFWRAIWNWVCGEEWRRFEFRLLTPSDSGYSDEPYEQTLIW